MLTKYEIEESELNVVMDEWIDPRTLQKGEEVTYELSPGGFRIADRIIDGLNVLEENGYSLTATEIRINPVRMSYFGPDSTPISLELSEFPF